MNEGKSRSSQIWSWIGKAAVVFTLIWVLIQLYNHFKASDYSLSVYGDYGHFICPDKLESELTDLLNFNKTEYIEKLLQNIKNDNNRKDTGLSIKNHFAKTFPSILNKDFRGIRSIWFFEIKNNGRKEIKDLHLELPFDGYYRMYPSGERVLGEWFRLSFQKQEQERVFSNFAKTIKIGSLRPSNIVSVIVWSGISDAAFYAKDTKVTYPEGAYRVDFPIKVRGLWGQLYHFNERSGGGFLFVIIVLIIGLTALIIVSVILKSRESKVEKEITEEKNNKAAHKGESTSE